jgi:putative membrane protein
MSKNKTLDWILRFVKGFFIGSGFILPGVSGGALAAVFGIYERMISFIANITRDLKKNLFFFLPVGFGGVFSVFLLSFAISFFLGTYETQILWFFVGCIVGTLPALWKEAGKHGRAGKHLGIMAATAVLGFLLLRYGETMFIGSLPLNIFTWLLAGALIGLGAIVPGLSPSNFLVYFGMYKPMTDGIKDLDFAVIIPVGIGAVACVLLLSKVMHYIFNKAYTGLFHFIFGIVLASTVMIIPFGADYTGGVIFVCIAALLGGIALGYWMCGLEEKYKHG